MFRFVSSFILIIAFAIQTFQMGGMVIGYYLDSAPYSKNCENKAKPVLKCNGKCQLAKKILEKQKQDERSPERKSENKSEVIGITPCFAILPFQKIRPPNKYLRYQVTLTPTVYLTGIFRPPCLV
jgi:hypothetical protein